MHDALPDEVCRWRQVEESARRVFAANAFHEVRLPVLEPTTLFVRSIGEQTDIVSKEMYHFIDQGDEHLCLRPEGTAGAARAWLQAGLQRAGPQRWFYIGPMFRRERPQKGRLRQFQQIGAELFGVAHALADAQMLHMGWSLVRELGLEEPRMEINSLGCAACRPAYREKLLAFLHAHRAGLCETCRQRSESNPMRVLDCKQAECQRQLANAPEILEHLCPACDAHFTSLQQGLRALGTPFRINPRIVRGLDYYNRTAFEIVSERLGAQGTILAGGRYDGLIETLGGPPTPAIGFAAGLERLALLLPQAQAAPPLVCVIAAGDEATIACSLRHAETLRQRGIATIHAGGGAFKRQFRTADREGARYCLILGEDEMAAGEVCLKDMRSGAQQRCSLDAAIARIAEACEA